VHLSFSFHNTTRVNRELHTGVQAACAKQWRTAPRPTVGAACQEGFEQAAKKTCKFVRERLASMDVEAAKVAPESQQAVKEAAPEPQQAVKEAAPEPQQVVREAAAKMAPESQQAVIEAAPEPQQAIKEEAPEPQHAVKEAAPKPQQVGKEAAPELQQVVEEVQRVEAEAHAGELLQDVDDAVERLTEMLDLAEQ
jgi:hypothetical protein